MPVDAATLKGVILANELSGQPMAKVGVVADGANLTTSEDFGRFTLEFPQKKLGDPVDLIVKLSNKRDTWPSMTSSCN